MALSMTCIILAGGIRPTAFQRELGTPVLCLPLDDHESLLLAWLEALRRFDGCDSVLIVVSDERDARAIQAHIDEINTEGRPMIPVEVLVDRERWRGTAGTVYDLAREHTGADGVLVIEGSCLPPIAMTPIRTPLAEGELASVAVSIGGEPAGVYAFTPEALEFVPDVGFFDIKEQLLPKLHGAGHGARAVVVTDRVLRLWERDGYLQAIGARQSTRQKHRHLAASDHEPVPTFEIAGGAIIDGQCVVRPGAVIEDGAVVHDSVVFEDAVIRSGAIVSRSIVGTGAEVQGGTVLKDSVHAASTPEISTNRLGLKRRANKQLSS